MSSHSHTCPTCGQRRRDPSQRAAYRACWQRGARAGRAGKLPRETRREYLLGHAAGVRRRRLAAQAGPVPSPQPSAA